MKTFWKAVITSYLLIIGYLFGIFFPFVLHLVDTPEKAEIADYFGIYMIGFFIIPPFLGAISYFLISRFIGNPQRHPILFIPYYVALYQVAMFISMSLVLRALNVDSVLMYSWQSSLQFFVHFLIITMMVYVITPKSR